MRRSLYLLSVILMMALTAPLIAQDHRRGERPERGYENRDVNNSPAYRAGYKDGQQDAQRRRSSRPNNRTWRDSFDREAYRAGYQAAYNEASGSGRYGNGRTDRNNRGGYDGRGPYGQYGQSAVTELQRLAQQNGYDDGVYYAEKDMQGRHSPNPTNAKGYKDADHNYQSSLGSKSEFQRTYREAFVEGYRRTYR
ncbi:MAG TPA: hypothetical protein VFH29_01385 [Anaerolineales bacterium]|nr:hypothetical protein [Anaerolineales bacterium]